MTTQASNVAISAAINADNLPKSQFTDAFSEEIWDTTYKHHGDQDVNDTFFRVAKAIASVEETEEKRELWFDRFYDMLTDFKATTGGRIYTNAGTEFKGSTLINCFVSPLTTNSPDSLDGIFETLTDQAKTLKSEGGWGHNFSNLRPRGSFIHGVGVDTPGAVKFMELFDKSSEIVTSGSGVKSSNKKAKKKIRKGAMMAILDVWHPDIVEFIQAKQTPGRLTKFNISVNATDEFMNAVIKAKETGEDVQWNLEYPDTTCVEYDQIWKGDIRDWKARNLPVIVHDTVSVLWLWNLMMTSTYNRAEPGIIFLDRANDYYSFNYGNKLVATNPCGEQVLPPAGSCDLGSINLTQFINEDGTFNYEKFKKYAKYLVRFLDNVNSYTNLPLEEYTEYVRAKRRIGCGILGWGSMLYMMKIRFGSDEAQALRDKIMEIYAHACHEASIDLAEEKGMFNGCIPEKHAKTRYISELGLSDEYQQKLLKHGIRNSALMSCQPTGNTSIFANVVSGGIEPIFAQSYVRTVIVNVVPDHLKDVTPEYWKGEFKETSFFKPAKEGDEDILRGVDSNGTVYKIDKNRGLTKEVPCIDYGVRWLMDRGEWDETAPWAVTAMSLTPDDHVNDLKGFARWIDSSISKTVNVPYEFPFEQFEDVYLDAYKEQYIKGITTYRTGTMTSVLAETPKEELSDQEEIILDDVKLPDSSPAMMKILKAEGRKWYLTVLTNQEQTEPLALFVHTNAVEKTVQTSTAVDAMFALARRKGIPEKHIEETEGKVSGDSNSSKIARAISLNLRHGVKIKNIVFELDKIEDILVGSFLFQVKKFLSSYVNDGEKIEGAKCDTCGSENVVFSEGCSKCMSCGSSKCS